MKKSSKHSFRWGRWLGAGFITIAVLWFTQQIILRPVIETVATNLVGARVTLGGFFLNIFTQQVRLTDLKIYNEEGFPPQIFFDASEITVQADVFEALAGKFHFPLIVFNLKKMIIFKNAQGKLNVDELKIIKQKLPARQKAPSPNFRIDVLKLNIEQVIVEDEGKTPPMIEAYDLNLKNKTINNIDSASKLVGVILYEILKPTAIQSAGLYAATTLLGVAFLPGLAIGVAIANDEADADLSSSFERTYQQSLQLVERLGQVKRMDNQAGLITANIYGCDINIRVHKEGWFQSRIVIKARKYFLAKPEIAGGLLYQLKQSL